MVMFWVSLLAISILLYVLLDGVDLGIGILFGWTRGEEQRRAVLECGRADLGRQRDLAGGDWRHSLGSFSGRLRDPLVGILPSALFHAGWA
jgi:hypothetical protein